MGCHRLGEHFFISLMKVKFNFFPSKIIYDLEKNKKTHSGNDYMWSNLKQWIKSNHFIQRK